MQEKIKGAFYGVAIGDAIGVPAEFKTRAFLRENPVDSMTGYGSWHQPPGTFSDDASLTFCTAESLLQGYDINNMAALFVKWYQHGYWGAHDEVFDIGHTTRRSLQRVSVGTSPLVTGGFEDFENGNGSLMRMMPVALYAAKETDIEKRYHLVREISGITHQHFRSVLACFIYTELMRILLSEPDKQLAYQRTQQTVNSFLSARQFNPTEVKYFNRILQHNIALVAEADISASGYVLHTLESALWSFLNTDSYQDCVLRAVNLGEDTDTTGAVAGALAGLYYGIDGIPPAWITMVAKSAEIAALAERFNATLNFQPA
ncbi:ADP-ribosylglycohydrolase family protein [Chitinophaga vietnamensis]|uniref:ADP-ribosylglycohydrolase family protein n=1 Tax=Chitinophaga vietnamensis TaxID=2593957 RepID=UPI001177DD8B|nr:ADP-ribosylglycohydrolase family protein [Chitinophaga vietnamensis]